MKVSKLSSRVEVELLVTEFVQGGAITLPVDLALSNLKYLMTNIIMMKGKKSEFCIT